MVVRGCVASLAHRPEVHVGDLGAVAVEEMESRHYVGVDAFEYIGPAEAVVEPLPLEDVGFGTIDEMFEALTLMQTRRIKPFPVILVCSEFWNGLVEWMEDQLLKRNKNISPDDLFLFTVLDDPDDVVNYIKRTVII